MEKEFIIADLISFWHIQLMLDWNVIMYGDGMRKGANDASLS